MNKKLFVALTFVTTSIANAETLEPFPSTDRGIKFVKQSEMNLPPQLKKELIVSQAAISKKGYIEKDNSYIRELINMKHDSIKELRESDKITNPYDTHLRRNLSDIKLSFDYKGIPGLDKKDVIGYAAGGGYKRDKGKPEGWTGIATFFEDKFLGACVYNYDHILAIQLDKDTVKFLVNKKPTNTIIQGTPHNGFLYDVTWYTDATMSSLKCANKKFDKSIQSKMLGLASKIDAAQSGSDKI